MSVGGKREEGIQRGSERESKRKPLTFLRKVGATAICLKHLVKPREGMMFLRKNEREALILFNRCRVFVMLPPYF